MCWQSLVVRPAQLVLPSGALAEPSARAKESKLIALLEFGGPSGASVRGEIMRFAAANFRVASTANLNGQSICDFALDHGLDVVVQGAVRKRKGSYQIRISFHHGATGRSIRGVNASVVEPVLDHEVKRRIQHELRTLGAILPSAEENEIPTAVPCRRTSP